jgi:thioredoxin reductase (NADPH)
MVTPEEIASVDIFADLEAEQRERLSLAAADISLQAGEYAAHEGDDRAPFAVLDGQIEPVKHTDGIEQVVGRRLPGEIFGEFPLVFGTVFPVGFRAAEPSRVMRIEARDYHALTARIPEVAKELGRLAAHRASGLDGLQGLAADPPPPRAIVVGHR